MLSRLEIVHIAKHLSLILAENPRARNQGLSVVDIEKEPPQLALLPAPFSRCLLLCFNCDLHLVKGVFQFFFAKLV